MPVNLFILQIGELGPNDTEWWAKFTKVGSRIGTKAQDSWSIGHWIFCDMEEIENVIGGYKM